MLCDSTWTADYGDLAAHATLIDAADDDDDEERTRAKTEVSQVFRRSSTAAGLVRSGS